MTLNKVQKAAYKLIQSDARFLYSLTLIQQQPMSVNSNYIMMSQPYLGLFADGAEQWCKKVGLRAPMFSEEEKRYYADLRQALKLYDLTYLEYKAILMSKFKERVVILWIHFWIHLMRDASSFLEISGFQKLLIFSNPSLSAI